MTLFGLNPFKMTSFALMTVQNTLLKVYIYKK